jgi:hypothetical protein
MTFLRFRIEVSNRRAASSEQECSLWPDESAVPSTFDECLRATRQRSVSGQGVQMDQMTHEAHGQEADPHAGHKMSKAHETTTVTPDILSLCFGTSSG